MFIALLAAFASACSDRPVVPDGPDAGPTPLHVTILTHEPPALIAFREEASTQWQTLDTAGTGIFQIAVTGPYRVVVACGSSGRIAAVVEYARTPTDRPVIEHTCGGASGFPFRVRGQMLQEGLVSFGGSGRGQSAAPWTFELPTATGVFDFVAFFGSLTTGFDRIAIRRDIAITGDLQLGAIDVAQEHTQALVPTRFTAADLDLDEQLSATLSVQSGNTTAFFRSEQGWEARLAPDSALRETDGQRVSLSATLEVPRGEHVQQRSRTVDRGVRAGGPTVVTLMEPMGPIGFETTTGRLAATWASLPAYDELDLWRESFSDESSRFVIHDLLVSRAFIDAVGVTSTTLDFSDVPGFRPEWRHDPMVAQVVGLDATRATSLEDSTHAGVSEDVAAPAAPGVERPRLDAHRAFALAQANRVQARNERQAVPR